MGLLRRLAIALPAALLLAGMAWGVRVMFQAAPAGGLESAVRSLAGSGRFQAAEDLLTGHLGRSQGDGHAHFLLAQLLIERPDQPTDDQEYRRRADRALAHLDRALPAASERAALVQLYRGKALHALGRWDELEAAMTEALRLDPTVPEAGWALLELYYLQGRASDAIELAMRLHAVEPDPGDRVQFLLELLRQDAQPPDMSSLATLLGPIAAANPDDRRSAAMLGLALVRSDRPEQGLEVLRANVERHPDDPGAWVAMLSGLEESGSELESRLAAVLDRLPPGLAGDPRLARFRGRLDQERGDWPAAVASYRVAVVAEPLDARLWSRLGLALRNAGDVEEAEAYLKAVSRHQEAMAEVRGLYQEADSLPDLGAVPRPDLYRRIAEAREKAGRPDEARAWYGLIPESDPHAEGAPAAAGRPDDPPATASARGDGRGGPARPRP